VENWFLSNCVVRNRSPKEPHGNPHFKALSQSIARILGRVRRTRLVVTLKSLRKPFAPWPILRAISRLFRTQAISSHGISIVSSKLKRQIPSWSLLIILLLGVGVGFYAATAISEAVSSGQSKTPDFTIGASPSSATVSPAGLATFTVSLTSLNGFTGSVNLNATLSPRATNVTVALNPSSVSLLTGSSTSAFTVSTPSTIPIGTYVTTISGASGKLYHNVTVFMQVTTPPAPDFLLSANPGSLTIAQGSSGSLAVTMTSVGGFSGTISLTSTITPSGTNSPTVAFNPNIVTVVSSGSASSVLTASTTGNTIKGSYTVIVLAKGSSISHTISISLVVQ
jgi:hypothetical protein